MNILISILLVLGLIFICVVLFLAGQHYILFNCRQCKHCSHFLIFRGEKEHKDGNVYLFQCPKCGAWEEISVQEFYTTDAR